MKCALDILKANGPFYIATVDGDQGCVRPFGFTMKRNNALYFCTSKVKDVCKQMVAKPKIEICSLGKDGSWLRIRGKIAFDDSRETKAQAFEEAPNLLNIYPKGADDEQYVTFYFVEAKATVYSFAAPPQEVSLL